MEIDKIFHDFDNIEVKIEKLIEICQSLKIEKDELQIKVDELQKELNLKSENENRLKYQREMVAKKVDGLLSKLNDFLEPSCNDE